MKRVLTVAAVIAIAIPALADSGLVLSRVNGTNHAQYVDGKLQPMGERQTDTSIWDMTTSSGYYWGSMASDTLPLDWGDLPADTEIQGLQFGYAVPTTLVLPATVNCTIIFYGDFNGFNNNGFYGTFGFAYSNLPTANGSYNAWIITSDLEPNATFPIVGNDLDGDGKADFGYSYWFPDRFGQGLAIGPSLSNYDTSLYPRDDGNVGDPNYPYAPDTALWEGLGAEEGFDRWTEPNTFTYLGTSWFGGWTPGDPNTVFSQFYMNLFGEGVPGCPNPGASGNFCTADIDGSADCIVGLPDLAALLSAYNNNANGDLNGDSITNLADLALLLGQYGDDCN